MNFDYDDDGYPRQPSADYWDSVLGEVEEPSICYPVADVICHVGRWIRCR